jgi:hypothetical protein
MGRSLQVGYSNKARPYGKPNDDAEGLVVEYVGGRKVSQVPAYAGEIIPGICIATTRTGAACKATPLTGSNRCVFHSQLPK